MLNPHMSCLKNSVKPNHATSDKPAAQELHFSYLFDDTS